ncbi:MAG: metallophosphatase family protein [Candidatus Omnitrophica bacterium]|nr:metallophosphatase family protein [Candidatus Omnitrophota bacterium]
MRYAVFSDIHANLEALEAVVSIYQRQDIDTYLCAGDVVGYGANPNECIQVLKTLNPIVVAGNHDWAVIEKFSIADFNPEAKEAILWTRQQLSSNNKQWLEKLPLIYEQDDFVLVHGSLSQPEEFHYLIYTESYHHNFKLLKNRICFLGHTHIPVVVVKEKDGCLRYIDKEHFFIEKDKQYIINVGSVGQPRDGKATACYCIYDSSGSSVSIKRVSYDIFSARQKIIRYGLPRFLGDRLLVGN